MGDEYKPPFTITELVTNLVIEIGELVGRITEKENLSVNPKLRRDNRIKTIYPFEDGNGRTGRLWHSLILQKWKPLFAWLPIETLIHEHQDEYYRVLNQANTDGESTVFIEFMLWMIRDTLYEVVQDQGGNVGRNVGVKLEELKPDDKILILLKDNLQMTAQGIADVLGKSRRQIERIIAKLKDDGKLERIGASKAGHWVVKGVDL